jgi:tyrosyl-tRNA synthetase
MDPVHTILSIGEEVIGGDKLAQLLANKPTVIAYDGFEPSGRMHIAQGLLRAHNTNKFIDSGVKFKFWVADWFALMNLKLGGNMSRIQTAGKLMIETWKACGMKLDKVDSFGNPLIEFIWSSQEINSRSDEYWKWVLDIGTKFNLGRIKKCTQIMGRKDEESKLDLLLELETAINKLFDQMDQPDQPDQQDQINRNQLSQTKLLIKSLLEQMISNQPHELAASQIFYPVMQCADIFFLKADICSLGMDQRKVNMLALEYCDKIKLKNKPIIVSHHMIMGLDGSDKMSKSNPENTIFMDDSEADVKRKITKAFCEPSNITKNPLLDWVEHIIFPLIGHLTLPADIKWNEPTHTYFEYAHVVDDFSKGIIQPKRLKSSMITHINQLLEPVREHFRSNKEASTLLQQVKSFTS